MNLRHLALRGGVTLGATVLFACASTQPPTARYASSESSIRAAEELNANATPAAQLHLKLAKDQQGQAKRLMASGDNERAEYVLMRAEADADVAVALAKEADVRKRATDAIEQVRKARSAPMIPGEPNTGAVPRPNQPPNQIPAVPDPTGVGVPPSR